MRRQGIYGANLPTRKSKVVAPSDFLIGGIIGQFERKYKSAFLCRTPDEAQEIFGQHLFSSFYGWDALKGFFDNIVGVDGKVYVKSHVGFAAVYDGVTATVNLIDAAVPTIRLDSAYQTILEFSTSGNRTGYKVTNGNRFLTAAASVNISTDLFVVLDSVAGVKVGDIMKFVATGGGGATVYKKITQIDQAASKVIFVGAFHATANMGIGDVASVLGFKIQTYRQSINGMVTEVEEELGKVWCTMEPEVTDFYVQNVHATNKWLMATDLASVQVLNASFPVDVATITYLASGADGTAPTTVAHWANDLLAFDNLPIRMLTNCETAVVSIQKAGEVYCKSRMDNPKWIYNLAENRTKAQLVTIGNNYQRSDDVLGVCVSDWLKITDPFTTSSLSPDRHIPCVGHVMGAWIRSIGINGIHYIPSVYNIPLLGLNGVVGNGATFGDIDRTDLADAGINIIQYVNGAGYIIRNFFTPSTATEFKFANGILMREYIKLSVIDSLASIENEPNNFDRIKESKMAILNFFYRLWDVGSTGNVPTGETFGQGQDSNGNATKATDHFYVQADAINNTQASINNGERNLDSWFTFPTPAGSVKIGVGLWLR